MKIYSQKRCVRIIFLFVIILVSMTNDYAKYEEVKLIILAKLKSLYFGMKYLSIFNLLYSFFIRNQIALPT